MSDFITLSCPSCNGKLQITEDIDRFACSHCGNEHVVKRSGGIVSLKPVFEAMSKGVDSTASELALVRLDKEISELEKKLVPIKASVESAGAYLVGAIVLVIIGLVVWIFGECAGGGLVLITIGFLLSLGYFSGKEKSLNQVKLEKKLEELKTSRQNHHDKVNSG